MSLQRQFGLKSFVLFCFALLALFLFQKHNDCKTRQFSDKVSGDEQIPRGNHVASCVAGVPCQYLDAVDLRIVVLTFNRWQSLERLLSSLNDLQLDGDLASVEIWIDRSKDDNRVDEKTLTSANNFRWRQERGQVRVHVQESHVGICGQWIDTWKPGEDRESTIVLILEDDISLSPFAYRWLKAAHKFYTANDDDLAGITLQSEGLIVARSGGPFRPPATDGPAFTYALVGSWGFSPRPRAWRQFQQWYHEVRTSDVTYRPYVKDIVMSNWYKIFGQRKEGGEETMWTMWFIAFCHEQRLFTLYNNLNSLENKTTNCLAVNRREPGLHFHKTPLNNTGLLLRQWKDRYVAFTSSITRYGFDAKRI